MYFCSLRKVLSKYLIADKTVLIVKVEKEYIQKNINKSLKDKERDYEQTTKFFMPLMLIEKS